MSVIYVLIPIAILLTALGIYLFFWAVKSDQFNDLEKQGLSILFDKDSEFDNDSELSKDSDSNNNLDPANEINDSTKNSKIGKN